MVYIYITIMYLHIGRCLNLIESTFWPVMAQPYIKEKILLTIYLRFLSLHGGYSRKQL